jgi:hypothetical protein
MKAQCRPLALVLVAVLWSTALLPLPLSAEETSEDRSLWNPLTWKWTPTDEEIQKYRRSWNPMANGPILLTSVDISPKGQFLSQFFVFGETGHLSFDNKLTTHREDSATHLNAVAPFLLVGYGITDHFEINVAPTAIYWQANQRTASGGRARDDELGLGDTAIYLKYRPIVQDPESWRPSMTIYNQVSLPTSDWANTRPVPGGFSPLGRLPATRFGALSFTEGVLLRKNLRPFRLSGGVFYTYDTPGNKDGMNTYGGDIVNTRFIIEHMLDDNRGFGYNLEFLTLHVIPHRLDGHAVNLTPSSSTLFGIEPAIQYKFTKSDSGSQIVGAAGVQFTIAGQNNLAAIYPTISLYYSKRLYSRDDCPPSPLPLPRTGGEA